MLTYYSEVKFVKKFFENPEVEVIKFSAEDVIATSGDDVFIPDCPDETPGDDL